MLPLTKNAPSGLTVLSTTYANGFTVHKAERSSCHEQIRLRSSDKKRKEEKKVKENARPLAIYEGHTVPKY
jgi:hypothetical protein